MLKRGGGLIIVTSPSQAAAWQLFESAERSLAQQEAAFRRVGPFELELGQGGRLVFSPPAELLRAGPEGRARLRAARLLLVDEDVILSYSIV